MYQQSGNVCNKVDLYRGLDYWDMAVLMIIIIFKRIKDRNLCSYYIYPFLCKLLEILRRHFIVYKRIQNYSKQS